jgi:hypothetical protein
MHEGGSSLPKFTKLSQLVKKLGGGAHTHAHTHTHTHTHTHIQRQHRDNISPLSLPLTDQSFSLRIKIVQFLVIQNTQLMAILTPYINM